MDGSEAARSRPKATSIFVFALPIAGVAFTALIATAQSAIALAAFCLTLLGLVLAVRLWTALSAFRLDVLPRCDARRLYSGETFSLWIDASNRKILPVWLGLDITASGGLQPLDGLSPAGETSLAPFSRRSGTWEFRASRRGIHAIGPIRVLTGDPLGLWSRERTLDFRPEIIVYPRIIPTEDLILPFRDYFGIHPARGIIEDPAWYEGTREYTGTKPARSIHWKASARFDSLQEKIFEPTSHRKAFFLLDGSGFEEDKDEAGFETALEVLASLATLLAESGASIAAATDRAVTGFPPILPLGRGPEHLGSFLELLARCRLEPGQPIASLLGSPGSQGSSFIVLARKPGPGTGRFFSLPATRRDRILFVFAEEISASDRAVFPSVCFSELMPGTGAGS